MSGKTLDDVCELLEQVVNQLSKVWSEVEFIKTALVEKEKEIDSKRWKNLMEKLGDIDSSVDPMQSTVVDGFAVIRDKLDEFKKEVIEAIPDSE
jgi:archaellum component FlaC